jgi:aromatic ring hydroxylase
MQRYNVYYATPNGRTIGIPNIETIEATSAKDALAKFDEKYPKNLVIHVAQARR